MDRLSLSDRLLLWEIGALERATAAASRLGRAMANPAGGERGQTPTEYLMIVGFMAAVIIFVFVMWYWENVEQPAKDWSQNVQNAVKGPQAN